LDKERQTYGMKESVLAKLYVQILGISPESDDGKRLIHWRRPNGGEAADIPRTCVFDRRERTPHAPPHTHTPPHVASVLAGARGAQTAEAGDFGTAIYDSLRKRHACSS
jgi:hypothetical protein